MSSSSSPSTPSPSIPPTMKAWTFTRRGPPSSVLNLLSNLPTPIPGPNELLVKITHVGSSAGIIALFSVYPHFTSAPCIPELDFSGVVVAKGPQTKGTTSNQDMKIGDEIFGTRSIWDFARCNGALCEYVVVTRDVITWKPRVLGLAGAAGLGSCGITALQACRVAGIKKGDRVLVTGASGGLGSILVQYVRGLVGQEGTVVGTCSGRNVEMVKGLGADEVVDYTVQRDLSAYCAREYREKPFDAIFDIVGDYPLHRKCPAYLKEDGMFVLLGDMKAVESLSYSTLLLFVAMKLERFRPVWLGGVPRQHRMYQAMPNQEDLTAIERAADEMGMKMPIEGVWKMEDAKEAYERLASQRARGKVVIKVDPDAQD